MSRYFRPDRIEDVSAALATGGCLLLAGATDHVPTRGDTPHAIIDLSRLPGLRAIERRGDHWWLPCLATWSDVIAADLPPQFAGLQAAARQVGGVQIQNRGTVVGNLCNASPAADGIPCLLALDATVVLSSGRAVPVDQFVRGPRHIDLAPMEFVLGLRLPHQPGARAGFLKLGARRYLVISMAMVALVADMQQGRIVQARIAIGACSARAQRLPALEAELCGQIPSADLVQPHHLAPLTPIDDVRASAGYRRHAALELVRRAVAGLA